MHLRTISNGMGGQSMRLLQLAVAGELGHIDVSITADTGSENDCLWSTGRRSTSKEFFDEVIRPLAMSGGIDAAFVRSRYKDGSELPPLHEEMNMGVLRNIPMFGSKGGRYQQTCTDKWKLRAIKQEGRRRGAKTMLSAIGLHVDEQRRLRGPVVGKENGVHIFQSGYQSKSKQKWVSWKWMTHWYPLIARKESREDCRRHLDQAGIPYLLSSECDMCPHKNGSRWLRTSPEMIDKCAEWEAKFEGKFFLTPQRIPLKMAIMNMRDETKDGDEDFGCQNDVCRF